MVYVPKTLMVGRCWRCGKRLYKGEDFYRCDHCNIYICPICHKKTFGKCPCCQRPLKEV